MTECGGVLDPRQSEGVVKAETVSERDTGCREEKGIGRRQGGKRQRKIGMVYSIECSGWLGNGAQDKGSVKVVLKSMAWVAC